LRYISKNRIALYGYLENLYQDDGEIIAIIETNKTVINTVTETITNTLAGYVSPNAEYNEEFRRDIGAIWTILKKHHKQEKEQLYPLYPAMHTR
jgi:Fic family protein